MPRRPLPAASPTPPAHARPAKPAERPGRHGGPGRPGTSYLLDRGPAHCDNRHENRQGHIGGDAVIEEGPTDPAGVVERPKVEGRKNLRRGTEGPLQYDEPQA